MPALEASNEIEPVETDALAERFRDGLNALVEKLKEDRYILAAILFGSYSYDEVWEKSDIDMFIIGTEDFKTGKSFCLTENGVNIHAQVCPRSKFKQSIEGSLQSDFMHSAFSRSTLLFTKDETLRDMYEDVTKLGSRDKEIQLLRAGSFVLPSLAKAEKWLYIKKDPAYSLKWIMYCVDPLATMETVLNGEITGREVVQQAMKFNPEFFRAIYTDLIHGEVSEATVKAALDRINAYMDEKIFVFQPILDFLNEAGGVRSTTELNAHFKKTAHTGDLSFAYEWLADKEIIAKVSTPLHLFEKSRVAVNETAYYYDGGDMPDWAVPG